MPYPLGTRTPGPFPVPSRVLKWFSNALLLLYFTVFEMLLSLLFHSKDHSFPTPSKEHNVVCMVKHKIMAVPFWYHFCSLQPLCSLLHFRPLSSQLRSLLLFLPSGPLVGIPQRSCIIRWLLKEADPFSTLFCRLSHFAVPLAPPSILLTK